MRARGAIVASGLTCVQSPMTRLAEALAASRASAAERVRPAGAAGAVGSGLPPAPAAAPPTGAAEGAARMPPRRPVTWSSRARGPAGDERDARGERASSALDGSGGGGARAGGGGDFSRGPPGVGSDAFLGGVGRDMDTTAGRVSPVAPATPAAGAVSLPPAHVGGRRLAASACAGVRGGAVAWAGQQPTLFRLLCCADSLVGHVVRESGMSLSGSGGGGGGGGGGRGASAVLIGGASVIQIGRARDRFGSASRIGGAVEARNEADSVCRVDSTQRNGFTCVRAASDDAVRFFR